MYERTKSEIVQNDRDSFKSFYIVDREKYYEAGSLGAISSIQVTAHERFNGAEIMRQVTLADIEKEFGAVEAQIFRMETLENSKYDPPVRRIASGMTIWTERSVVWIGTNEMWENMVSIARNPAEYK